jgi:hypothetical protein
MQIDRYIRHWKHACDFGVGRKNKNFWKDLDSKIRFSIPWEFTKDVRIWNSYPKEQFMKPKVALPKLSLKWIIVIEISNIVSYVSTQRET